MPSTLTAITTLDGTPLANAKLTVKSAAGRALQFVGRPKGAYVTLHVSGNGRKTPEQARVEPVDDGKGNKVYRLPALAAGSYTVTARLGQDFDAVMSPLTIAADVLASISGVLFNDDDANGVMDAGEAATGVRKVLLASPAGQVLATVDSDAAGVYTFPGLAAGTYRVTRQFPKGYRLSNNADGYVTVTLAAGQALTGINLGSKPDKPVTDGEQQPETPGNQAERAIRCTIVEGGDAYGAADAAGFDGIREWCSVNWNTGKINPWAVEKIATCNKAVAEGKTAILTVTVPEHKDRKGERCKDFSVVADQLLALGLDPRVIVTLINEGQHRKKDAAGNWYGPYWPDGNIGEATEVFAVPIGVKLKAAGFKLACPSITWGTPADIVKWLDLIWSKSPAGLWDYIDGHLYLGSVGDYETVGKCYADWAAAHGVEAISTEWSHKVGNEEFAKVAGKLFAIMDRYFSIHCWFSMVYNEKFNPKNPYAFRDGKKTVVFDALAKAMARQ